jgi:hypothetical protein
MRSLHYRISCYGPLVKQAAGEEGGAMDLIELCTKLKFEYLPDQLDTVCELAAK